MGLFTLDSKGVHHANRLLHLCCCAVNRHWYREILGGQMEIKEDRKDVVTLAKWQCQRCLGIWSPRIAKRPIRCAKCKTINWWRKARIKKIKPLTLNT